MQNQIYYQKRQIHPSQYKTKQKSWHKKIYLLYKRQSKGGLIIILLLIFFYIIAIIITIFLISIIVVIISIIIVVEGKRARQTEKKENKHTDRKIYGKMANQAKILLLY